MLKKIIRKIIHILKNKPIPVWFIDNYNTLKNQENISTSRFHFSQKDFFPCLTDQTIYTRVDRHYTYHPVWAAQKLVQIKPTKHIDISSILHFSTILSAFIETEFYDYRPANVELSNFYSSKADLKNLHFENNSIFSLSCMHTVEHIGLGRYGEPIDYDGDLKAMKELARVIAKGGNLLFVTPIGKENRIYYNAHRVYTADSIKINFENFGLTLKEFTYISQKTGGLQKEMLESFITEDTYGCGCFWFTK